MGYVKRIIKNILIDGKPNIFFMHIPKTGGTSIDFAISRHYPIGKYYVDPSATVKVAEMMAGQSFDMVNFEACFELRENLLAYKMAKGTKYVTGHVPFRLETWKNFHEQYIFSTVLRDPVKRYISEFLYKKYKEKEYGNIDLDFSDYLASDIGKRCASTYVRYFVGISDFTNPASAETLQIAKDNLSKFKVVGFLDDLDSMTKEFKQVSGLKLNIPHQNKSPKKNYQLNQQEIEAAKQICEPDIAIYEYAKKMFTKEKLHLATLRNATS